MANNKTIKNKKLEKKFNDTADNVVKDVGKGIDTAAAAAIETVKTYLNDDEMNGGKKKTKEKEENGQ